VCDPTGAGFQNHLVYVEGEYQVDSVKFIVAGLKGEPLPKSFKSSKDTEWNAMSTKAKNASKPWGMIYKIMKA
jgi:hypothetical protein